MAAGTFDPKLTDGDFRARRFYLPADAFALVERPYETASDPMLEDPWHELINLPTDVLLRTSDHHGRQIAQLVALWSKWIELLPLEEGIAPYIFNVRGRQRPAVER